MLPHIQWCKLGVLDVHPVPLQTGQSLGGRRAVSTPFESLKHPLLRQSLPSIHSLWVSHYRMIQPFIYAQADFNLQQSLLFLSFHKYSWVLPLHSSISLGLTRALCSCGSNVPGHWIHTVQGTQLLSFSVDWSRTPLVLVIAFVTHFLQIQIGSPFIKIKSKISSSALGNYPQRIIHRDVKQQFSWKGPILWLFLFATQVQVTPG